MSKFGFENAQLPQLTPLRYSFVADEIEDELKSLFFDVFDKYLAEQLFDANVLGMPHLGSIDLVKKFINADGLVLLPILFEPNKSRYLYKAWKSQSREGRGLFFLKTYLQVAFPGLWTVEQQMQLKTDPYPTALFDRSTHENDSDKYLTSRVNITILANGAIEIPEVSALNAIISAILPARFVPKITVNTRQISTFDVYSRGNVAVMIRSKTTITV
jgi:hypothetical protein